MRCRLALPSVGELCTEEIGYARRGGLHTIVSGFQVVHTKISVNSENRFYIDRTIITTRKQQSRVRIPSRPAVLFYDLFTSCLADCLN